MKQFLVLGCGYFGGALAKKLYALGHEVVVVDSDQSRVDDVMNEVGHAVVGNATDEATLLELDIPQFDTIIVSIGESLESNILATYACKQAGAQQVISKVDSQLAGDVLAKIGADFIVRPEYDMAVRLASTLSSPNVLEQLTLEDSAYNIARFSVPPAFAGTLRELALPQKHNVQVIMIQPAPTNAPHHNALKQTRKHTIAISGDTTLEPEDTIIVIGTDDAIVTFGQTLQAS